MRIKPITPGTRPELAAIEAGITAERGRVSLLYQLLLNSPAIAQGWEQLLTVVRNRSSLSADIREMVILRIAVINRAPYEFEAHVSHADKAGVSAEKIQALREIALSELFTGLERDVLILTDTMTLKVDVPDDLFETVKRGFSDQGMIDLTVTIAAYNMVSRFLSAMKVGH
jgi:AhpD family alkylhydroperoxidase